MVRTQRLVLWAGRLHIVLIKYRASAASLRVVPPVILLIGQWFMHTSEDKTHLAL
jgi:hypothetical protein